MLVLGDHPLRLELGGAPGVRRRVGDQHAQPQVDRGQRGLGGRSTIAAPRWGRCARSSAVQGVTHQVAAAGGEVVVADLGDLEARRAVDDLDQLALGRAQASALAPRPAQASSTTSRSTTGMPQEAQQQAPERGGGRPPRLEQIVARVAAHHRRVEGSAPRPRARRAPPARRGAGPGAVAARQPLTPPPRARAFAPRASRVRPAPKTATKAGPARQTGIAGRNAAVPGAHGGAAPPLSAAAAEASSERRAGRHFSTILARTRVT
ncbi:MAG: hypothetical protein HS111_13355 [Kofleriaceae bacterium]|nr:hypothetical protein [Kofleriaceae bacterium]